MNKEDTGSSIDRLAQGFRKRTLKTAKLGLKVGLKAAKRQLGRVSAPSSEFDEDAAKKLVADLGQLKGLVMKVGQMASYLPGALPPKAQDVLAQLQADSVAMRFDRVREVIESEFDQPIAELFESFDEEPFAAASIGQVHRAMYGGREVAVKVQYPGIEEALRSDLSSFGLMTRLSTFGLPIDGAALVRELNDRILEECDYELEAQNQIRLGALLRRDPDAEVPLVVEERSTRRVLTTEMAEGMSFADFTRTASQKAKNRAGAVIFRTCYGTLFQHRVYNGDPHPGNYLFHADGRVTFLDFGCVREFDPVFIDAWKVFARGVLDDDRSRFPERLRAVGLVGSERGFDWDQQWVITQYLYRPFIQRDPFMRFDDAYVRHSYGLMIFDNPNQRKTAVPPEWLLLNRLQWGLNAVLAKLDARASWPDYFAAAVDWQGPDDAPRRELRAG